jgi:hypothetical protein
LKIKWIIKREICSSLIKCKASCGICKRYKDECIFNDPQMEACIFIVNQEQAFEAVDVKSAPHAKHTASRTKLA